MGISWDNITTDPNMHDEENYIYLVHAINLETKYIRDKIRFSEGNFDESQNINLSVRPLDINKLKIICCSLIGKGIINGKKFEQLHTWAQVGLILKVPKQNILRSGTSDLGSNFVDSEQEINKYNGADKGDPVDLLFNSHGYNEVVVQGSTSFGNVEVVGVFCSEYDNYLKEEDIVLAHSLRAKTKTPLIRIERKKEKLTDSNIHFEFDGKGDLFKLTFVKNGRKFYCNFNSVCGLLWGIYASGDYGTPFVRSEEDFNIFIRELKNLSDEEKEEYKDILELIPYQYEMCKKYFQNEVTEEALHQFDYVIQGHSKRNQNNSHKI